MLRFTHYFWGTIVRPRATFDALASERSVRWALAAAGLGVVQVWGNIALHTAFGLDWLGTRPNLSDPTFVAGFGLLRVNLSQWVPVFAALMPLMALLGLVITGGVAQLMSGLWRGQGTFEQTLTALAFATAVPNLVIGATSEWVFSVPMDLLSGHPYWWVAAMNGELGPTVAAIWNTYVFGVYLMGQWVWSIALGSLALRRVQRISAWAAIVTMLVAYAVNYFVASIFVR